MSAKQLLINQINNMNFGVDQEIYNKSTGNAHYEISKLAGDLTQEYNLLQGATLDLSNQMSTPDKTGALDLTVNVGGQSYNGQVCLSGDKVIINKAILEMIAELFPQTQMGDIAQYPDYLYFSREEMSGVWESMLQYRDNQAPQELKDLLVFLVEAIPDQYFTASLSGVTFKLDQAGLEDVIYNVLLKVRDEKERFAGIIVGMSTMYGPNPDLDPETMREDIIAGIDKAVADGSFPTKEQIHLMSQFVQVQDFYYQASLPPSAAKEFKLTLKLSETSGLPGEITITSKTTGSKNNINSNANASLDIKTIDGNNISCTLNQTYMYQAKRADSQMVMSAKASNPSTGGTLLDFELKGDSSQQADSGLKIALPELNEENSMDITSLIEQGTDEDRL